MRHLTDDIARVLASPMPRRKAFKLFGGALAGGILASMGVKPAHASESCGFFAHCTSSQKCCTTGFLPFCAPASATCCGFGSCSSGGTCCGSGISATCANGGTCCGSQVCTSGDTCCGAGTFHATCAKGGSCCGSQVCSHGNKCCQTSVPFCYSNSRQCPASDRPDFRG